MLNNMLYDLETLTKIRRYLHSIAELSGKETQTSEYLISELRKLSPDYLITHIGGYGFAVVFDTSRPGPVICFRAELDALPIEEQNDFPHKSRSLEISHKCGHDGHAIVLLGLADWVKDHLANLNGRIILLFQPAEETAQGAKAVLADSRFSDLNPDFIFGLHNLPGFPIHSVIVKQGTFAVASRGLKIKLHGKTSHAGHPEDGISPLSAMLDILNVLLKLPDPYRENDDAAMITIIHLCLGEEAFGTAPGEAEIMATLRASDSHSLDAMASQTAAIVADLSQAYHLKSGVEWVEDFADTVNDSDAASIVIAAAQALDAQVIIPELPFRWTEDFSFYSKRYKTAFMGLGAGLEHPQLHNPDYDFPDALLETGVNLFANIILEVRKSYAANQLD